MQSFRKWCADNGREGFPANQPRKPIFTPLPKPSGTLVLGAGYKRSVAP